MSAYFLNIIILFLTSILKILVSSCIEEFLFLRLFNLFFNFKNEFLYSFDDLSNGIKLF